MIENSIGPRRDGVARRTGRRGRGEISGDVVGNVPAKGLRAVPCRLVTAQAVSGIQRVVIVDVAGEAGSRRR